MGSDPWLVNLPKGLIVAGEYAYLLKRRGYKPDGTKTLVVYCPGKSAGGANIVGFGPAYEMARRGHPVICGDYGDTPTQAGKTDGPGVWGNDAAQTKLAAHVAWAQDTAKLGAKAGKVCVFYGSHGCALAYAYAAAHPTQVQLIAGAIGTADVEDIRANNRGTGSGYQASIEAAYTNNAGWQAARATHNPVEVAAGLTIPQLDFYSTTDPICVPDTHAALATAAGSYMTQVSLGALGHGYTGALNPPTGGAATAVAAFCDWVEAHL